MKEVSTADLRNNLSDYIWRVSQTRETVTITSRGRPVAVLAPVPPTPADKDI